MKSSFLLGTTLATLFACGGDDSVQPGASDGGTLDGSRDSTPPIDAPGGAT